MDFERHYTEELERFRQEVRAWLDENIPEEKRMPVDPEDITDGWEHYDFWREKHRELAAKGWLYPTYPKEYGGGGLSPDHESIIEEEFQRGRIVRSFTNGLCIPTLLVWATEEQRQKYLKPILTAEKVAFQNFTEPNAGSDLASVQSRAVRDGDDWIITGQKQFVSGAGTPDLLFGPMMTDPDAPRHRNLGFFMISHPSPGLTLQRQNLLNGHRQNFVFMDGLRVPGDALIGGDHQGWQVTNTTLEQEHGGRGLAFPRDEAVENLITYVQETKRNGGTLGQDPIVRQETVDAYIDAHIHVLFAQRNYWMYQAREEMSYHGSQSSMFRKVYHMKNADRIRDIMGMYSVLGVGEPRAAHAGEPEVFQRDSLTGAHPGGTIEVQKVIIARRIGISRTRERAAPTPATATTGGA